MLEHKLSFAGLLLLLLGCGANPVEKDLSIRVNDQMVPLRISTLCGDATCGAAQRLHVEIAYAPGLAQTETAELDQYRVDYELDGVKGKVPYFAARKKLLLTPGESASLSLDVSGSSQRSFLIKALGHGSTTGIGRLSFAGYDHDNNQILVKTQFELEFGEIDLGGTATTSPPPPSQGSDAGTRDAGSRKAGTPDAAY